jgi:hypothetical protein
MVFLSICLNTTAAESFLENATGVAIHNSGENETTGNQIENTNWQTRAQEVLINALSLTGIKYKYSFTILVINSIVFLSSNLYLIFKNFLHFGLMEFQ